MDVFDLVAKIRLDSSEYEDGVGKAKGTFSSLASGVGKGLATVAKIGGAAISAGAAGVAALTKMGVEGYAQYEQLAGGAKLLWGTAYDFIADKASGAYATVQMSQNEYLAQVNAFSTGLKTALGGNEQAAAELADRIITAEADIVAATGATRESVENAFNGIMKSNFTMLDNLQLGITPTKEGFQEVIDKVNEWNRANGEATSYQIDNLADCQSALLDYIEMQGLSGYAAEEAAGTIQGSLAMMKASWENLVVGMADENANLDVLINNFVESTATAASNLLPRIEQTLQGIGQLIEKMAPIIAEALPVLVESLLPTIIEAAVSLIAALANALVEALPAVKTALLEGLFIILTEVFGVSEENARAFTEGLNDAFTAISDGFNKMVEMAQTDGTWLNEIWTGLKNTAKLFGNFLSALWKVVSTAFKWCVKQIQTDGSILSSVWNGIQTVISVAVEAIQGIITAFTQILQGDWEKAWDTVVETVLGIGERLYEAGKEILESLWDGLKSAWKSISDWWDGLTFSKKSASVDVDTNGHGGRGGKFATGLNYVPYDDFPAILHRGEAVLTSAEARMWRNGEKNGIPAMAGGVVINQYIQSVPQTPVEFANTTEAYFEQARWTL